MAMELKTTEEITRDGVVYIVETYVSDKTGHETVVETPKQDETIEPEPQEEPFDNEVAMLELLSMTEYNTCLLEMQMEF
jgi:hypothetical protein